MKALPLGAALSALLLVAPAPAFADLIAPVTQTRTVAGVGLATDAGGSDSDADSDTAPDFAPWSTGAAATASVPNALGSGGGTQDSSILADAIHADGSAFANAESYELDATGDASGSSYCFVTFDLTAAASYSLQGSIAAFDSGNATLRLKDASGDLIERYAGGPAETVPLSESGVLPAGRYTLELSAVGSVLAEPLEYRYAFAEYLITLDFTTCESATTLECFGDGSGSACPCANEAAPGSQGGCANSTGLGATLRATGSSDLANQAQCPLVLHVERAPADKTCIWLQGATAAATPFRDGILCVGNPTLRLPRNACGVSPQTIDAAGALSTDDPTYGFDIVDTVLCNGEDLAALAPASRRYQVWFRDGMGPCDTGSNLTNAVAVEWVP